MAGFDWKKAITTIAPALGAALPLPPPLGPLAAKFIAEKVLGKADATEDDMVTALASGDPKTMLALKEADQAFALHMKELGIKEEQLHAEDRASARTREIATGDRTPQRLAYAILGGFFLVLVGQFWLAIQEFEINSAAQRTIDITTGVLFALVLAVKDYIYGSSAGSDRKTDLLHQANGR